MLHARTVFAWWTQGARGLKSKGQDIWLSGLCDCVVAEWYLICLSQPKKWEIQSNNNCLNNIYPPLSLAVTRLQQRKTIHISIWALLFVLSVEQIPSSMVEGGELRAAHHFVPWPRHFVGRHHDRIKGQRWHLSIDYQHKCNQSFHHNLFTTTPFNK